MFALSWSRADSPDRIRWQTASTALAEHRCQGNTVQPDGRSWMKKLAGTQSKKRYHRRNSVVNAEFPLTPSARLEYSSRKLGGRAGTGSRHAAAGGRDRAIRRAASEGTYVSSHLSAEQAFSDSGVAGSSPSHLGSPALRILQGTGLPACQTAYVARGGGRIYGRSPVCGSTARRTR